MCKKITNEEIIKNAISRGYIEEKEIALLKRRSNADSKDYFYELSQKYKNIYEGIPVTREQGHKGLAWLRKFLHKRSGSPYGWREIEIINDPESENDFTFKGFYDAGRYGFVNLQPIYAVGGMEYVPLAEPYIIG